MIYLNIRGNFGNQLFEYAFARSLQERYNQKIVICTKNVKKYDKDHVFNLDGYKLNSNVKIDNEFVFPWYANMNNIIIKIFRKVFPNFLFRILKRFGVYLYLGRKFKEIPDKNFKNFYIDGYWQCDKYFENVKEKLISEFSPKNLDINKNEELYNKILNTESVCVTIRRGDYVSNEKYKKIFYICNEEYFYKAIEKMKSIKQNVTWFIFSDDIEWAKENIKIEGEKYFESGEDTVFEKIRLMSACKNFILSNSSFSWWAQYLSNNENKVVIAPEKWNNKGEKSDIFQKNWILINVES